MTRTLEEEIGYQLANGIVEGTEAAWWIKLHCAELIDWDEIEPQIIGELQHEN